MFDQYSLYYDILYRDKDYIGEVAYVKQLLSRYNVSRGTLLELGSGTGVHGRLLARSGFAVHGIERSAEMVSKSQEAEGFTCQVADLRTVRLSRAYDAVLSLFHVVSYQVTNADVQAIFSCAAAHLNSGGIFVFDFWYSPAVYTQKVAVRIKRAREGNLQIVRIAEPYACTNENRVDVNYTIYARNLDSGHTDVIDEVHPMRHFSLPEIDLLAESVGLSRICSEEFMTGRSPGEDTWGLCVVLRKD